ncbi:hypothetical protein D3C85_1546700 [compost metagenome]
MEWDSEKEGDCREKKIINDNPVRQSNPVNHQKKTRLFLSDISKRLFKSSRKASGMSKDL